MASKVQTDPQVSCIVTSAPEHCHLLGLPQCRQLAATFSCCCGVLLHTPCRLAAASRSTTST
jgi:hypothetical protein